MLRDMRQILCFVSCIERIIMKVLSSALYMKMHDVHTARGQS